MTQIEAFHKLLNKFKFTSTVPDNVQLYVSGNQKKALINSLKTLKMSSLFYNSVLNLFFAFRKKGYGISLFICKTIVWILLLSAVSFASGGIIYITNLGGKDEPMIKQAIVTEKYEPVIEQAIVTEKHKKKQAKPYLKYRLGINPFMSRNNDLFLSGKITGLIISELSAKLGQDYILDLNRERENGNVNIILSGAVGKLGNELILSAKITDAENSSILFSENTVIENEDEVDKEVKNISEKIAEYLKNKYN